MQSFDSITVALDQRPLANAIRTPYPASELRGRAFRGYTSRGHIEALIGTRRRTATAPASAATQAAATLKPDTMHSQSTPEHVRPFRG